MACDTQAEELPEHLLKPLETDPVGHMLVHGPTLQGVEVLVPSLVPPGEEVPAAVQAAVEGSSALDDLPPDATLSDPQVVGQLDVHLLRVASNSPSLAERASQASDHDPAAHPELLPAPPPLLRVYPPERLVGPEENLVPLVIEVSALVNVFEFREGEMAPAKFPARRGRWNVVRPSHLGRASGVSGLAPVLSRRLDDRGDVLRHPPQGRTVLSVIGEELLLDGFPATRLPRPPPRYALRPGGVGLRPGAAQVGAHILQPVRVGREVDAGMDDRKDVAGVRQDMVHQPFLARLFPHPP